MSRSLNWRHQLVVDEVRAIAPASLLDVGCGDGWLLDRTRERVGHAVGVERRSPHDPDPSRRDMPTRADVIEADAASLPFPRGSFDWVVLRNVLHHVDNAVDALAEAARVAKIGLLITEPCFEQSLPSQRLGERVERWVRSVQRWSGLVHHDNLDAHEILSALSRAPRDVEIRRHHRVEERERAVWLSDVASLVEELPPSSPLRAELDQIDREWRHGTATAEGVLMVRARW